eukprot:COSAG01_NODE_3941_length_5512_cov_3.777942_2_plen_229_part_00
MACSQAEALGAAAQQALQVQGGGRCRASELRKKRDKMQRKVTITEVKLRAGEAGGGAPGGGRQGDPRAADGPTVTCQPASDSSESSDRDDRMGPTGGDIKGRGGDESQGQRERRRGRVRGQEGRDGKGKDAGQGPGGGDRKDHHKSLGLDKCWSQKATYRGKSCPIYQTQLDYVLGNPAAKTAIKRCRVQTAPQLRRHGYHHDHALLGVSVQISIKRRKRKGQAKRVT